MPRKKMKNEDGPDLAGGVLVVHKPAVANGQAADAAPETPTQAAANPPPSASDESRATTDGMAGADDNDNDDHDPMPDAFIGHRPLIRATLPKTENDVPPPRAIPEFTMHQRPGRAFAGRGFRPHGFGGHGSTNGSAPPRDGNGPDGNRAPGPGGPGGKSRHRRRHRRPR